MKIYAYDIECLPNLFTATFVNVEDPAEVLVFYIGLGVTKYKEFLDFLYKEMTLVGYNNHSYDDPMLRFIMNYGGDKVNQELHTLSGKLVDDTYRSDKALIELRYPRKVKYPWKSVDLMRILAFDKLGISLKQTAINLKWHKIQDMPIEHWQKVEEKDLELILSYNLNDVLITKRLYEEITAIRKLREDLSKLYGVDLTSASDSRMANLILEHIWSTEMKVDARSIREGRTPREKVLLGDCIAKFVNFKTVELQEMLDRISSTIVYNYNRYKYNEKLSFANCNFALGVGGLHTEDEPGVFVTDEKYIVQDMDVASYYPNLIINNNFYPQHLGPNFIKVLKKITAERIGAKKGGDKVKADGLKITINSIFGKLGSEDFWLYDPKQMLSTTISGQMGLLMLVEELYLNGINVISCNTDGVVCQIPRELETKYYEIAHAWEKATKLELEYTPYKKYVRRDVNSYITEKADGETKEKGAFLKKIDLKKGYHMPIVAKALYAYFIKGIPVRQTLEECQDIMDFCISQKSGSNFSIELKTITSTTKLQKTNRFYITKKGGSLIKREMFKKTTTGLYVGKLVRVLNDFDATLPFNQYEVDLAFYEKEVMKIVDEIEPKQLNLFDMSEIGKSSMPRMAAPTSLPKVENETPGAFELNKLGKNQLVKKLEYIAASNQMVRDVSPRYVFVLDFNQRTMMADVYCLSKGVRQSILIDKKAYKKEAIKKGDLVFCSKFQKLETGHSVVEYRITDFLESDAKSMI